MKQRMADGLWNGKRIVAAGVACYVLFLMAAAPAGVMEWLLPKLSGERLRLVGAQGSLWRGEAGTLLLISGDGARPLGVIRWRMAWSRLLRGELAASLEIAGETRLSHGTVALVPGGMRLHDVDAAVPIAALADFFPGGKLWRLGGTLEARAETMSWGRGGASGAAEINWRDASSGLSQINPFGDYRLTVKESQLELATLSGPLRLTGSGKWGARGISFEGMAQAEPAAKSNVQDFLRLLGREDGRGGYRFALAPPRQP